MRSDNYSHGSHTAKVLRSSKAKYGAFSVLSLLCHRAEYDKPEVTITKAQLSAVTGLERKAVQRALRDLRDAGSIVPIKHFEGGKGNAVTYQLVIVGQGGSEAEIDPQKAELKGVAEILKQNPGMQYSNAIAAFRRSLKV